MKKTNPLVMTGLATALLFSGCKKGGDAVKPAIGPGTVTPQGIVEGGWKLTQADIILTEFGFEDQQLANAGHFPTAAPSVPPYKLKLTLTRNGDDQKMLLDCTTSNNLNIQNIGTLYDLANNPYAGQFVDGVVRFGDINYESSNTATVANSTINQAGNPTLYNVLSAVADVPEQQVSGITLSTAPDTPVLFRIWTTNPVTGALVNPNDMQQLVEQYIQNQDIYVNANLGAPCLSDDPSITLPSNNDGFSHRVHELVGQQGFYSCERLYQPTVQ